METIKKFIRYYGPYRTVFFLDLLCAACISLIDLAYPQILRTATNTLFTRDSAVILKALPLIAVGLFIMYVIQSLCKYYVTYQGHMMGAHMERDMRQQLFDHINIDPANTRVPDGNARDQAAECASYDTAINQAGGIDIQVLGIGRNGHIGFNEPADTFVYGCHIVNLTQSTIQANRRFFESEDDVPRQAISLGIGSIMNARRILLLATGADKAEAIRNAVYGDINPRTQASILRTHSNVIFLLDKAAAGLL